jgi:hypothetical protein
MFWFNEVQFSTSTVVVVLRWLLLYDLHTTSVAMYLSFWSSKQWHIVCSKSQYRRLFIHTCLWFQCFVFVWGIITGSRPFPELHTFQNRVHCSLRTKPWDITRDLVV